MVQHALSTLLTSDHLMDSGLLIRLCRDSRFKCLIDEADSVGVGTERALCVNCCTHEGGIVITYSNRCQSGVRNG